MSTGDHEAARMHGCALSDAIDGVPGLSPLSRIPWPEVGACSLHSATLGCVRGLWSYSVEQWELGRLGGAYPYIRKRTSYPFDSRSIFYILSSTRDTSNRLRVLRLFQVLGPQHILCTYEVHAPPRLPCPKKEDRWG